MGIVQECVTSKKGTNKDIKKGRKRKKEEQNKQAKERMK
jgi:hypothetical protein